MHEPCALLFHILFRPLSSSRLRLDGSPVFRGTDATWHLLQLNQAPDLSLGTLSTGSPACGPARTSCFADFPAWPSVRLVEGSSLRIFASDIDSCPGRLLRLTCVRLSRRIIAARRPMSQTTSWSSTPADDGLDGSKRLEASLRRLLGFTIFVLHRGHRHAGAPRRAPEGDLGRRLSDA